jgi:hypothetical protein
MTREQILLISLLLGKALDAIITKVSVMTDEDVMDAITQEETKTDSLLEQMRNIKPGMGVPTTPGQ